MKKLVALGDRHTGHVASILPPRYHLGSDHPLGRLQREVWKRWVRFVDQHQNPDVVFDLGDMIEGKNLKSGASEIVITDREEQALVSAEVLAMLRPRRVVSVFGTPYHTGTEEDWESVVCRELRDRWQIEAEIHDQAFVEIEDVGFHLKHKVGASGVPYGSHTAPARDSIYLELESVYNDWPLAQVVLRGHTHQYSFCGNLQHTAMVLPSLKAAHDKYGARQVSRHVDFGLVEFVIDGQEFEYRADITTIKTCKPPVVRV